MNSHTAQKELSAAYSRFITARERHGLMPKYTPGESPSDEIARFEENMGVLLPKEYHDFVTLCGLCSGSSEPFFRGLPFVSPKSASEVFLLSETPHNLLADFPFFGFCESDGAGLFINITRSKSYDAPLFYVAPGVTCERFFMNIRSFLNGVSECLEIGMVDVVRRPAFGRERELQNAVLGKYRFFTESCG